jgi:hypothetical protein
MTELYVGNEAILGEPPLTCVYCKHAPATHLLVADLPSPAARRITDLACAECGKRGVKDARDWPVKTVHLFTLTEETDA